VIYSYSSDDGSTWTQSWAPVGDSSATPPTTTKLAVAGGLLNLDNIDTIITGTGIDDLDGSQFIIRPHRADIDLAIGPNASITVNNVGCDVFGGLFEPPFATNGAQPVGDPRQNLFEVIGKAIAFLETNSQTGAQEILDMCMEVDSHIGVMRATIGARMNRTEAIAFQLDSLEIDENDRLSSLEDVDLSELMIRLSQQQLAYQSVLQSSSMIMQMSLMDYL
jgi:flagellar hook-associated protein 3 FlgL